MKKESFYSALGSCIIRWAVLCLFILLSIHIEAQITVSGNVKNEQGIPIEKAQVIFSFNDKLQAFALTDVKGAFTVSKIQNGKYTLEVSCVGYASYSANVSINKSLQLDITLKEKSTLLDSVTVVGKRPTETTATGYVFYLSEKAKKSGNPYKALQEIPALVVNPALKSVTTNDGKAPLVLIDGIPVNTGINPIDPSRIESVEVVEIINARYIRSGAEKILNIKLKKQKGLYSFFEANVYHYLPFDGGYAGLECEIGGPKFSVYGALYYPDFTIDNSRHQSNWQKGEGYTKESSGNWNEVKHSFMPEFQVKWLPSSKDYLVAFFKELRTTNRSHYNGSGNYHTDKDMAFDMSQYKFEKSTILTWELYHKHTFSNTKVLESTLNINKNGNDLDSYREEKYPGMEWNNAINYRNNRWSGKLNIDYAWTVGKVSSLNFGTETKFVRDRIDEVNDGKPMFKHRDWNSYIYASFSSSIGGLMYMLSGGIEGIWLKAGDRSNSYYKPQASVSGTYRINKRNSVRLSYTLTNTPPAVELLNPYNTSTDSLVRYVGNPLLLPTQYHNMSLGYTFNKSRWWITESVNYLACNDIIQPLGYTDKGIFINTYTNSGHYHTLSFDTNIRYNSDGLNLGMNFSHLVYYFQNKDAKKTFSGQIYLVKELGKFAVNMFLTYRRYTYSSISRMEEPNPQSSLTLTYNITPNMMLICGMNHFWGRLKRNTELTTDSYRSVTRLSEWNENTKSFILFRWTIRKNLKRKINASNVMHFGGESGIHL
jgi:hypothetical protein